MQKSIYQSTRNSKGSTREKKCTTETTKLRSQSQLFNFRTHCFICGQAVKGKEIEVYSVRTNNLQTTIIKVCHERNNDWTPAVRGRIETINDLHAGDAIYHQTCSVNFRTSKAVPKAFFSDSKKDGNRGRPKNDLKENHFKKLVDYLHQRDDEQITIKDLVNKINNLWGENVYSPDHLKRKLRHQFCVNIIITNIVGKSSVVTLRKTAKSILQTFYNRPKNENHEDEKKAIIRFSLAYHLAT